jgi:hypothetical protein
MKARGILGRLIGPCADFINPTRNGRKYSEKLWENVFADPIMKERIESGCCFGELGHPADRTETDMEKIAICLREQPKKNDKGQLIAVFDILATPNGKILKTLCDYGTKIGVSSRGSGDIIEGINGEEVDPDTYDCQGWDAVIIPAVKEARMTYVTESLDSNAAHLKQALCESLENATDREKKVMQETLDNLNIKLEEDKHVCPKCGKEVCECKITEDLESGESGFEVEEIIESGEEVIVPVIAPEEIITVVEPEPVAPTEEEVFWQYAKAKLSPEKYCEICAELGHECECCAESGCESGATEIEECINESCADINTTPKVEETVLDESTKLAEDNGDGELIKGLQEALKAKSDLEAQVKSLQEQAAVSDAKVVKLEEECNNYKSAASRLSTIALEKKDLETKVLTLEESLEDSKATIEVQNSKIARLVTIQQKGIEESKSLNESLTSKEDSIKKLNEEFNSEKARLEKEVETLTNRLSESEKSKESKLSALTESLAAQTKTQEKYKKLANEAVSKYIECRASMLGVNESEITSRLSENFSLETVDRVCEDLKAYKLTISKLPYDLSNSKVRIRVNENVNKPSTPEFEDDEVSESLLRMSGLK